MKDYLDWNVLGSLIIIGAASYFVLRGYHRRIPRFFNNSPFFQHWVREATYIVRKLASYSTRKSLSSQAQPNPKPNPKTNTRKASIPTPKIFINYRRKDTKSEARLLYQKLVAKFPKENVMMDIDSIPAGHDFRAYLRRSVEECDVFLALIGPRWLEFGNLNNQSDWVRIEIEAALALNKTVIPIMVDNAHMPSESALPDAIKSLSSRNSLPLDPGRDFNFHIIRILNSIRNSPTRAHA